MIRTGGGDLKMLFTKIIYVLLYYPCSELQHMHSLCCSRLVTSALSVSCLYMLSRLELNLSYIVLQLIRTLAVHKLAC